MTEDETPIPLARYAEVAGRSLVSVRRDVKAGHIPAWKDQTVSIRGKVTSLGAIRRVREARAAKAEKAFMQKAKLS